MKTTLLGPMRGKFKFKNGQMSFVHCNSCSKEFVIASENIRAIISPQRRALNFAPQLSKHFYRKECVRLLRDLVMINFFLKSLDIPKHNSAQTWNPVESLESPLSAEPVFFSEPQIINVKRQHVLSSEITVKG